MPLFAALWTELIVLFVLCISIGFMYCADGDSDEAIIQKMSGAVKQKKAALGGHSSASDIASHSSSNRPMILIGG